MTEALTVHLTVTFQEPKTMPVVYLFLESFPAILHSLKSCCCSKTSIVAMSKYPHQSRIQPKAISSAQS